jgi:hypothetical protein
MKIIVSSALLAILISGAAAAVCSQEYKPVCAKGKTYSNACKARNAGAKQFTQGVCKPNQNIKPPTKSAAPLPIIKISTSSKKKATGLPPKPSKNTPEETPVSRKSARPNSSEPPHKGTKKPTLSVHKERPAKPTQKAKGNVETAGPRSSVSSGTKSVRNEVKNTPIPRHIGLTGNRKSQHNQLTNISVKPDSICPQVIQPVCANGKTYRNACLARKDGHKRIVLGACTDDDTYNNICPAVYDPVCGKGKTYPSQCEARKAGVKNFRKGSC